MAAQTTVRLSADTRDRLNTFAREHGVTVDRAVTLALDEVRKQEWRQEAIRASWEMVNDPADRAELAATMRYLDGDDA
jgi:predicted transcriptional regulator